ncbi:hypothetical protein [Actinomyces faecalis]|uniref:hypothetical protein n=1 Tax=Actinomyces faecalis TaxID=2722820 RepID=UPI001554F7CE|nr:hypothetical protein [Actinomyces faecalis]
MNTLNTTAKANTAELIRHATKLGYTVHRINTADTHRPIEVIPTDPTSYIPALYYTDGQWTIQTTSFGALTPMQTTELVIALNNAQTMIQALQVALAGPLANHNA